MNHTTKIISVQVIPQSKYIEVLVEGLPSYASDIVIINHKEYEFTIPHYLFREEITPCAKTNYIAIKELLINNSLIDTSIEFKVKNDTNWTVENHKK